MFASWVSQILLLFCLRDWNPAAVMLHFLFLKLPLCQLQSPDLEKAREKR